MEHKDRIIHALCTKIKLGKYYHRDANTDSLRMNW